MAITHKTHSIEDPKLKYEEALDFALKVKLRCEVNGDFRPYKLFGKVMCSFNKGSVDEHQMLQKGQEILANHPDLLKDFNTLMACFIGPKNTSSKRKKTIEDDGFGLKGSIFTYPYREKRLRREKNGETCTTSNHKTCTPSYCFLRPSKDKEEKSALLREVLNDQCAIAIKEIDSRDAERSELEKAMDVLEDQRFERDLLIHNVSSTLENMRKLECLVMGKRNNGMNQIKVRDHLSHSNLMCLRLIFRDEAERIIVLIGLKPKDILCSVILTLEHNEKHCQDIVNKRLKAGLIINLV